MKEQKWRARSYAKLLPFLQSQPTSALAMGNVVDGDVGTKTAASFGSLPEGENPIDLRL
jgi:hypothetical protein